MKNVTEHNDVGTLRIRAGKRIRRCRREAAREAAGLNILFSHLAHRGHVHDDATQVRIPEPNLDHNPAWASRHIQHAVVRSEIKARGDLLPFGNAKGIHHLSESAQPYWVFVECGEDFVSCGAK